MGAAVKRAAVLLLLCSACPETLGQQCPPNAVAIGQYTLSLTGRHPAGECISDADSTDGDGPRRPGEAR